MAEHKSLPTSEEQVELAVAKASMPEKKSLRFNTTSGGGHSTLVWKDLVKFVDDGTEEKKQILFGVSGVAKPGEMIALMGPSGSGKTTLLNILGGRGRANMKGDVYINGKAFNKSMRKQIAYVLQEDIFYTQLTVRQQLSITSHLRLPESLSREEKAAAVDHVIKTLRISKCQDTKILLISGGEKKRCNIGTELLTNPSILLLDEPTSGLDSTAAHALIDTMRFMADEKMTLISSIHQPSSKVFYRFDKLILLADGCIAYSGPPSKCMSYLASLGYVPPGDYNPADFVMDLVNSDDSLAGDDDSDTEKPKEDKAKSVRKVLTERWDNAKTNEEANASIKSSGGTVQNSEDVDEDSYEEFKYPSSYWTQFSVLFMRALIISKDSVAKTTQLVQTLLISLVCGLVWFDMPYTESRVFDRSSYIFFFMTFWFFMTLFNGMMQFLPERTIILKERAAGSYRLSAYYLSKSAAELPMRLALPCLFLIISYPMVALSPKPGTFFALCGVQLLAALCGEAMGVFIGTSTMDYEKAMTIATVASLALMLTGGYFIQNLPSFLGWIRFISPFKYSYDACIMLGFDRNVPCTNGEVLEECLPGVDEVDKSVAWDYLGATETVGENVGALVAIMLFFRLAAYLALRFVPHNNGRT